MTDSHDERTMSTPREMTDLSVELLGVITDALIAEGWTMEPCEKFGNWVIHRPDRLGDERHHLFVNLTWSRGFLRS